MMAAAMSSCRRRAADDTTRSDGGAADDATRAGSNYDGKQQDWAANVGIMANRALMCLP